MDSQNKKLFQLLRSAPTADSWCKALEDILGDKDETREFAISKLGDAGEYVTGIVEFSDNPDKSREALKEALNKLAEAWDPYARI